MSVFSSSSTKVFQVFAFSTPAALILHAAGISTFSERVTFPMIPMRVGPLVRATSSTTAVIWAEFFQSGKITISSALYDHPTSTVTAVSGHTINVGGRHFIALQLTGLEPATWYSYQIEGSVDQPPPLNPQAQPPLALEPLPHQCFRTLSATEQAGSLRIAYGSCRNLQRQDFDSLSGFGAWLQEHFSARDDCWPHLLLLIGDQIYADQPSESFLRLHPERQGRAQTFEDFASTYTYSWSTDQQVRQALATLPTYMIFDDHEIVNNFNISPAWRAAALQRGYEQLLVDGLLAYWIYQGWGNLQQREPSQHPLLLIMHDAASSGVDALEDLRTCISSAISGQTHLSWYYEIPSVPPIFVLDVRVDRPAVFDASQPYSQDPTSIMGSEQMQQLVSWLYAERPGPSILISSVPLLLPPLIGLAEYLMGIRPWHKSAAPLRRCGRWLARLQHGLAMRTSFDHWAIFNATWRRLVEILGDCRRNILVLSGDVHFSYAMRARRLSRSPRPAQLYQFVSSPLRNILSERDRQLVLGQARLQHLSYGGLSVRMLPLSADGSARRVPHDLLLQNSIALVTLRPLASSGYLVQQEYLGEVDGNLGVVGRTSIHL
jgi:phosphodiesterase/alkaline phosphatase D-like protein